MKPRNFVVRQLIQNPKRNAGAHKNKKNDDLDQRPMVCALCGLPSYFIKTKEEIFCGLCGGV